MLGLYSQLIGADYVNNVISPFYRKLIQDTKDYEVSSLSVKKDTTEAAKNLRKLVIDILNALFRSIQRIPSYVILLCPFLRYLQAIFRISERATNFVGDKVPILGFRDKGSRKFLLPSVYLPMFVEP